MGNMRYFTVYNKTNVKLVKKLKFRYVAYETKYSKAIIVDFNQKIYMYRNWFPQHTIDRNYKILTEDMLIYLIELIQLGITITPELVESLT